MEWWLFCFMSHHTEKRTGRMDALCDPPVPEKEYARINRAFNS